MAACLRHRLRVRAACCRRRATSRWRDGSCCCPANSLRNIWVSFWRASVGFLIGGGIGFALGLANGLSRLSSKLTDTTLQMVRNIPHLALIPLVILWFGIDEEAKLFLVALGVFFPIYLNTLHGIRTVDPQLIEMGRIYGMTDGELFRRVILPGALPSIFVGLRYALGIMWLTLIVAETIAASSGIGYMAMQAREFLLIDVVVLAILIYALLGKLADSASRALERLTLSWHPAFQKALRTRYARSPSLLSPGAEPIDRADFVEQARLLRRGRKRRPRAFADHPGICANPSATTRCCAASTWIFPPASSSPSSATAAAARARCCGCSPG